MSAMEPPSQVPPLSTATTAPPTTPYPDSLDSSPRSRTTDTFEAGAGDPLPPIPGGSKLRLMCSYGGHIVPRPHDKSLCYVGGDTRIVVVDRNSSLPELLQRLSRILLNGRPFTLKYQLPSEDLDSLITVSSEEDLENMIDEYDRLSAGANAAKPSRIRLFLFPAKLEVAASMGPILDGSNKSDDWFLNALNGADILHRGYSDPASVDLLLGLENAGSSTNLVPNSKEPEGQVIVGDERGLGLGGGKGKLGNMSNQDVHSVPDSPVVETSSSFGSTSSSPSLANLPPIRVHVEGPRVFDQRIGFEEQFTQMAVSSQRQEEAFAMMSSPPSVSPNLPVSAVQVGSTVEYTDRIVSEDERSDHGVPVGYRKPPQPQPVMLPTSQAQQPKQISGDLPSPDSVASDSSLSNAINRQKPVIYQDQSVQMIPGGNRVPTNFMDPKMVVTDTGAPIQIQQVPDSGYVLAPQYEQQQVQSQQQQQHQQTMPQQFVHASNHYVHHLAGGVPLSYYPVYPSQQGHNHPHPQIDQRYQVYYVPAGQAHPAYNLPNYSEPGNGIPGSQPQNPPPNPTFATRNVPPSKAEIAQGGIYGTTTTVNPQLVQMPSHQHHQQQQQQFVGYSQIHHPSQSIAPISGGASANYAYELADQAHGQIYFTQPLAPQLGSQYQTMTSAATMVMSDASSAALPTEAVKAQVRTSQAL